MMNKEKISTRWFIDTEFNEDGKTIELISIALISDDGRTYYAVSADFNADDCNDWVKENVLPLLPTERISRADIANQIRELLLSDGKKPEIWGYFSDYDWVVFCQLFGRMIDLPQGFPMFCMDLKQLMEMNGIKKADLPQQIGAVHDALADAQWIKTAHSFISEMLGSGDKRCAKASCCASEPLAIVNCDCEVKRRAARYRGADRMPPKCSKCQPTSTPKEPSK